MKRIICVLLSVCMLFCLAACGKEPAPTTETTEPKASTEGQTPKTTEPTVPIEGQKDFTSYDELSNPGWSQGIDSAELVGTWEQAWAEVEGDRNEIAPGVCTIEITSDETGFFRFTYTNKDFPEENIRGRELIVIPGELYPGCGNGQWIGEVTEESADPVCYALTVLEDGTLLLQTYWEMDGMPWVSYGWYERIG